MMTAIEQTANANMMMSTTTPSLLESTHSSLLNVLPSRPSLMEKKGSSPSAASPKSLIDAKLNLLMKLVERVRKLDQVSVKTIPYLSKSGMIVEIPGPWSIRLSGTSTPTHHPERVIEQRGDEDDEGDEDGDNDDDDLPQDEEEDAETLAALAQLDRKKFVVRNEFGHVRIQPLIEAMENVPYGSLPERLAAQIEIGGHCVLSKKDFELCLERRWGQPHPLSGKFHPIAGTTIPETTLLFYTPRNEQELEMVWKIVQASYEWALSDQK